jgi:hypothetical protein
MKKTFAFLLTSLMVLQFGLNTFASQPGKNILNVSPEEKKVEVYYFHNTRRCATCQAVEDETKKALEQFFSARMKDGSVTFISINLEEGDNEAFAEKLGVSGQTLLLVAGDKKVDLTNDAFMYATTKPEKLHKEIRKTVDDLLK